MHTDSHRCWSGKPGGASGRIRGTVFLSVVIAGLMTTGADLRGQSTAPARSAETILAEIETSRQQFHQAVNDPAEIADPVRRKAVAPQAIPPLKTMVADFAELAAVQPQSKRRADQLELAFNAYLSVLGDQPTIDHLQAQADSKDVSESLRAQASQVLARWVLAGKDETAQSKLADQVQVLDRAHPQSEDLTFLTVKVSQSTLSQQLRARLRQLASEMQNPMAEQLRASADR